MRTTGIPIRVLVVEDSEDDARMLIHELRKCGYESDWELVETASAMRAALKDKPWDFIFSDFMVPGFGGMEALQIAKESGLGLPFVVISGAVGEEVLVEVIKAGASDLMLKGRLGRLGAVVGRELANFAERQGMKRAQIAWRAAFDALSDGILIHDAEFRILHANFAYAALARMPVQDVIGKPYWEVFPKIGGPLPGCKAAMGGAPCREEEIALPGGETYLARSFTVSDSGGNHLYCLLVLQDMTERNRVRDAVESGDQRFRSLIERASDLVAVADAQGVITYISPSVRQMGGYEASELLGRNFLELAHPDDLPLAREGLAGLASRPNGVHSTEFRFRRKDGGFVVLESVVRNALADPVIRGIVINSRDVTERKRAEADLRWRTAFFEALVSSSADGILVVDAQGRKVLQNQRLVELWNIPKEFADDVDDTNQLRYVTDQTADPKAFVDKVLHLYAHPAESSRDEIVTRDGAVFDRYSAPVADADGQSYGRIWSFRDITERKRAAEKLRASFEGAIAALAATVEQRDPYTAGHQRRVAQLAVAIGRELGFDEDRLTGLRVAGTILDIGKISVPAEILARPGRIGPLEFDLIKTHAQAGFDIVKGVEFPWPVADAMLQHHERLDGSGYPQGLKGEQIIPEARILAVADVVEAMSSHRPYRPGLGIDAALKEVEGKRGILFDPEAVDMCVRLFREKGFSFDTA